MRDRYARLKTLGQCANLHLLPALKTTLTTHTQPYHPLHLPTHPHPPAHIGAPTCPYHYTHPHSHTPTEQQTATGLTHPRTPHPGAARSAAEFEAILYERHRATFHVSQCREEDEGEREEAVIALRCSGYALTSVTLSSYPQLVRSRGTISELVIPHLSSFIPEPEGEGRGILNKEVKVHWACLIVVVVMRGAVDYRYIHQHIFILCLIAFQLFAFWCAGSCSNFCSVLVKR